MFDNLSDKLTGAIKKLRGDTRITETNIQEAIKEIRLSLLEADVNFKVVKAFVDRVKAKALGAEVLKGVSPGQQFVQIVHEELTELLGVVSRPLEVTGPKVPTVVMLVGLQGAGKTTTCGKLALYVRQKLGKKAALVPLDVYRPAAVEQLQTLGRQLDVACFPTNPTQTPLEIATAALEWARQQMVDVVIFDTAGRLQIDNNLMGELVSLKNLAAPTEILLVADSMLGQQAVDVAVSFHQQLGLSGVILTKVDGDARGGAALSIRESTGVPIKFLGVGEKSSALEVFHPDRLSQRILGMGDVLGLVERAQEVISEEEARDAARKMARSQFTVEDFLKQMQMIRRMGGIESLLKMIPGMGSAMKQIKDLAPPEKELKKIEAIIQSMTAQERAHHGILNGSRRKRIALGSGTQVSDVNRFIRQFEQSQKMMSQMMRMRR